MIALALVIGANVWRLAREFRAQIPGSRLTLKLIATFALLSLIPLAVVYLFAIQFLSKSVDSWFDVRIDRALDDAKLLSQSSWRPSTRTCCGRSASRRASSPRPAATCRSSACSTSSAKPATTRR
ncbi:MAG: hypothetical protein M5U09_15840 [Gammaproteobacteria bacterium]|nr:hypothetical protein [Gammaproteobacteria bacterium]